MNATPPSHADWEAWADRQKAQYRALEAERDHWFRRVEQADERARRAEAKVTAVHLILAATYFNPAKALHDIRAALKTPTPTKEPDQ